MKKFVCSLCLGGLSVATFSCHTPSAPETTGVDTNTVISTKMLPYSAASVKAESEDTAGLAAFKAAQKQHYEDSLIQVGAKAEKSREGAAAGAGNGTGSHRAIGRGNGYAGNSGSSAGAYTAGTSGTVAKKKSHAARNGALIGAGVGALGGALVTKHNRGIGALVGAAAGGGIGYGVGKLEEKKSQKQ